MAKFNKREREIVQDEKKIRKGKLAVIVVTICSLLLTSAIAVFNVVKDNTVDSDTKTLSANMFTYQVGSVDEEGEFIKDTSSCITKKFITTKGLSIEVCKNPTIEYVVHFYNEDNEYISSTEVLTADFDSSTIPEGAEFVKISVTPTLDSEVSNLEISGYAGQLTITYNK